jgi:hypothetical protein
MSVETDILVLSLAYMLLGVLLLVVLARLTLPRPAKAAAIVVTSGFYVLVFFASQNLTGWSAPVAMPDRFKLIAARVVEPNPAHDQPGAVHLWVEALDDSNLPSGVPRAYLLPYSTLLAGKVKAAQSEVERGHPQGGRARYVGLPSVAPASMLAGPQINQPRREVGASGNPSGRGLLDPSFLGGQSRMVDLAPLPPPALPPKDEPQ